MYRNTLARNRMFNRDPEEGGGGGTGTTETGSTQTETGDQGGKKTFTPITSQEEFDNRLADRVRRVKAQFADYDELKKKAAEADDLRKQVESDSEKAVREAREEAVAEERRKTAPRLVGAEFRAAAKGVLTDAQRDAFLEDADLTKYLNDKGEVDVDKVTKKVEALAPAKPEAKPTRVPRDLGQGKRDSGGKTSVSSAREDYLERRRKQLGVTA